MLISVFPGRKKKKPRCPTKKRPRESCIGHETGRPRARFVRGSIKPCSCWIQSLSTSMETRKGGIRPIVERRERERFLVSRGIPLASTELLVHNVRPCGERRTGSFFRASAFRKTDRFLKRAAK